MTTNACFIIAEAGVNHNGDVSLAEKLVDAAAKAGADAVKFQTFRASNVATRTVSCAEYQKNCLAEEQGQLEMLQQLELPLEKFKYLEAYCRKKKIQFLSTPFDEECASYLVKEVGMTMIKVPSGEVTNIPFLKHLARFDCPLIISTGMCDLSDVRNALAAIRSVSCNVSVTLLHCTSEYPCAYENVNLNAMRTLSLEFGVPVGLSDHSTGIEVPIAAAALGATIIEKHFTIDRTLPGPDHRCSLEFSKLEQMVQSIRNIEHALGDGRKLPTNQELETRLLVRRSLVLKKDLLAGAEVTLNCLVAKRSGGGISPGDIDKLVGARLKVSKKADDVLQWEDLHGVKP